MVARLPRREPLDGCSAVACQELGSDVTPFGGHNAANE